MNEILRLDRVSRIHGAGRVSVEALSGVTITVERGELVAIMGPSGSGKSTLLSLAGGLDSPTSGRVLFEGTDLALLPAAGLAALRRRRIGYVFQQFNLVEALTAIENVSLPLELDGMRARDARATAARAMAVVGIEHLAARFPDELSGGEQQRVAIARATVGERILLLADEPTGALDSVTGEAVLRLMRDHAEAGGSGLLVTHDARYAAWADRIVFLRDGRIVDETQRPAGPDSLLAGPVSP